jgi:hypothetical protein
MGRACPIIVALLLLATPARADDPSDQRLVLSGLAMAPPTYLLGVTMHEGSHALAAKLVGGTVDHIRLFPPGVDPRANKFRFGWVYARGLTSKPKKIFFYLAPKITDAIFLSAYTALVLTDTLPSNKYGLLALTVGATGFWVDFAKDVVVFNPHNDVVKVFRLWCMTGWKQIVPRLVYAGASIGLGALVAHGYRRTFSDDDTAAARIVPVFTDRF